MPPADDGYVRVSIEDWSAVEDHLREIAGRGSVEADADRIVVSAGSARFAVTCDGSIDAGMPLHELATEGVEALYFDHDRGRIQVREGDLAYEFRRP